MDIVIYLLLAVGLVANIFSKTLNQLLVNGILLALVYLGVCFIMDVREVLESGMAVTLECREGVVE